MIRALLLLGMALAIVPAAPHDRLRGASGAHRTPLGRLAGNALTEVAWMAVTGVVIAGLGISDFPLSVGASLALAGTIAFWFVQRRREGRRQAAIARASGDALGYLVGSLRAGASMSGAMADAAKSLEGGPEEVGRVLSIASQRSGAGAGAAGARALIEARATCPQLADVGALWEVAAARGIPVVALLEHAQRRLDHERRHAARTVAALQGPQATAVILAALPLAGVALGTAMGARPLQFLTGGGLGGVLLLVGTGLVCGGFAWSHRIIARAASFGGQS